MQYTMMVENDSMVECSTAYKYLWDVSYRFNMHCVNHEEAWNIPFVNYSISLF